MAMKPVGVAKQSASSIREVLTGTAKGTSARVQLNLKPRHVQDLEEMKNIAELSSYAEVVRVALRVLKAILLNTREGGKVKIEKPDGSTVELLVI